MGVLAKQAVHNEPMQCVVSGCGRWESRYNVPGHLLVDFPFTEEHRALWEVSEEDKAILDQGITAWHKDLAAQKKEWEKTRVKGKV